MGSHVTPYRDQLEMLFALTCRLSLSLVMIETIISAAFIVSSALTVLILLLPSQYDPRLKGQDAPRPKPTVQILVLGDIGRSPRMQYHALSIARNGGKVAIIGYTGNGKTEQVENSRA